MVPSEENEMDAENPEGPSGTGQATPRTLENACASEKDEMEASHEAGHDVRGLLERRRAGGPPSRWGGGLRVLVLYLPLGRGLHL